MLITCPKCSAQYQIPEEVHLVEGKKIKCSACQHVFSFVAPVTGDAEGVVSSDPVLIDPIRSEEVGTEEKVLEDGPVFQDDVPQPFMPVEPSKPEQKKTVGIWTALLSFVIICLLGFVGWLYRDVFFENPVSFPMRSTSVSAPVRTESNLPSKSVELTSLEPNKEPAVEQNADKASEEMASVVLLPQIQSVRFERRMDPVPTIRIGGILKNNEKQALKLPPKVRAIAYGVDGAVLFEKEIFLTDSVLPAEAERPFFGSYQPAPEGVQWVDVTF